MLILNIAPESNLLTNILNWVSAVGSIASIVGIGITLWQLRTVKAITERTRCGIAKIDALSEVSKCNEIVKETIPLIKRSELEAALPKLREVKVYGGSITRNDD